jgi:hypothetical protein
MPTEKKGSESAERSRNQKHSASSLLDDCDRPACDDMTAMLKAASNRLRSNTTAYTTTTNKTDDSKITRPALQCPPKSPELGRSSWTLLHAMVSQTRIDHMHVLDIKLNCLLTILLSAVFLDFAGRLVSGTTVAHRPALDAAILYGLGPILSLSMVCVRLSTQHSATANTVSIFVCVERLGWCTLRLLSCDRMSSTSTSHLFF